MLYGRAEGRKMAPAINLQISIREVLFRITDGAKAILIDGFVRFPSSLQHIWKMYLKTGHDRFR
jgi:hypothetical protein